MSGRIYLTEDERYFSTVPWCAELLKEPGWRKTAWGSRTPKGEKGGWEDAYFGEVLKTDHTIKALMSLYKKDPSPPPDSPDVTEVRTLLSVGSGVNGWPGVSHGGFIATILDEAMGVLISLNYDAAAATGFPNRELPIMTAGLNVSYKAPLVTPGDFLVLCKFKEIKGRKISVGSEIADEHGKVFATAEAIWIQLKHRL